MIFTGLLIFSIIILFCEVRFRAYSRFKNFLIINNDKLYKYFNYQLNLLNWIKIFLVGLVAVFLIFLILNFIYVPYFTNVFTVDNNSINFEENKSSLVSDWGTVGDFIGGTLNPVLTFLTVIGLIYTILQNHKALELNKIEMEQSRKALEQSAKAQSAIEKTQKLQQFDNMYNLLLNQLKEIEEEIYGDPLDMGQRRTIDTVYDKVFNGDVNKDILIQRQFIFDDIAVSKYFTVLYHFLKIIDEKIVFEDENIFLKKQYSNILRALIPYKLLQLLCLNCCIVYDRYKSLLETFSFFEHMPLHINNHNNKDLCIDDYFLCGALSYYDISVFGDSTYLGRLKNSSSIKYTIINSLEINFKEINDLNRLLKFNHKILVRTVFFGDFIIYFKSLVDDSSSFKIKVIKGDLSVLNTGTFNFCNDDNKVALFFNYVLGGMSMFNNSKEIFNESYPKSVLEIIDLIILDIFLGLKYEYYDL